VCEYTHTHMYIKEKQSQYEEMAGSVQEIEGREEDG
jgi:hypothetical protein